ncbi:MAG: tRNA (5-methylaminomethyl-2-thiouridine)(34)-methyltransferase MnmD [Flavobacteriales bacterium]
MQRFVKATADGSSTVFIANTDVSFHSRHGAMQESMHVFIHAGLLPALAKKQTLKIFEMGFGTGLNLFLTMKALAAFPDHSIVYHAIEKYPLSSELIAQLEFQDIDQSLINTVHQSDSGSLDHVSWKVHRNIDLLDFHSTETFDLVYFDAFAPGYQPELWTTNVFSKLFNMMNSDTALVTYCAKGQVKRNLRAAGFVVESIPGPPGKREMTRALKA